MARPHRRHRPAARGARAPQTAILRTLEALELEWDRPVLYQSSRLAAYRDAAERLLADGHAFRCRCSRSEIRAGGEAHLGPLSRAPAASARVAARGRRDSRRASSRASYASTTACRAHAETDLGATSGDYVIVRRDGLPAYHLAVVLDDAEQGVTTDRARRRLARIDGGARSSAGRARACRRRATTMCRSSSTSSKQKLSKQTGAAPVEAGRPAVAARVLELLGLDVPAELSGERPRVALAMGARALEHRRAAAAAASWRSAESRALRAPGARRKPRRRRRRACSSERGLGGRLRAP